MQTILSRTLSDTMYYRNFPVLSYRIDYPFFLTDCTSAAARQINLFYAEGAKEAEYRCRTEIYPQAALQVRYTPPGSSPFRGYEWIQSYRITRNTACITSLYLEQYSYMGGAHGSTLRTSQTWDFCSGKRLLLEDFFPPACQNPVCPPPVCLPFSPDASVSPRDFLLTGIEVQAAKRLLAEPGSYFEDYKTLVQSSFLSDSFYLTDNDLVIFYQQYDIAPYASGLPEFFFSLENVGN